MYLVAVHPNFKDMIGRDELWREDKKYLIFPSTELLSKLHLDYLLGRQWH